MRGRKSYASSAGSPKSRGYDNTEGAALPGKLWESLEEIHPYRTLLLSLVVSTVILGSIIGGLFTNEEHILSKKSNPLNVIFAKWAMVGA